MENSNKSRRTIFIGDVHGCLLEAKALVEILHPEPQDRVIFLGDLINRGPNSTGMVRFVHDSGFESLLGNHEDDYLREFETDKKYSELRENLGDQLHEWLKERPLFIETDDFIAVHAGLEPGKHPSESSRDLLVNIRTWDGIGIDLGNPNNPPWYDFYDGSKPVIYGHWARNGLNFKSNIIGLDSGCVYGKRLTAIVLERRELVQLKALRRYYIPPSLKRRLEKS